MSLVYWPANQINPMQPNQFHSAKRHKRNEYHTKNKNDLQWKRKNQCTTLYILHLSRPPTTLMIRFLVEILLNYYYDYYSTIQTHYSLSQTHIHSHTRIYLFKILYKFSFWKWFLIQKSFFKLCMNLSNPRII